MTHRLNDLAHLAGYAALLASGAIFGLFYAWTCSTMWGLDAADPRVAIAAMQAMNASVRNAVFFPAFFLTPVLLGGAAVLNGRAGARLSSTMFAVAAAIYLAGGLMLTMVVNVPMNQALAAVQVPGSVEQARVIWQDYSGRWQVWNTLRTIAGAISLLLTGIGLAALPRTARPGGSSKTQCWSRADGAGSSNSSCRRIQNENDSWGQPAGTSSPSI